MTVKELKEKLNQFDDNLHVMIPNMGWTPVNNQLTYTEAENVSQGVNELDGAVFIEDYEEETECIL